MNQWFRTLVKRVEPAGGVFVRMTGRGHRRYRLETVMIDIPLHGLESGRMCAASLFELTGA